MQSKTTLSMTFYQFEELHKKGYSLDIIFLLKQIESGCDVRTLCAESPKLEVLHHTIYRKGLINEKDTLTLTGKALLEFIDSKKVVENVELKKVKIPISGFDDWWKAYPGTDTFSYGGKTFSGTRSLRTKKEDCKTKFTKILEEGEYTVQDMIDALNFEVEQKKQNSVKEKTNRLSFMQNSLTYLNQRTFEPFIELVKAGIKVVEQPTNTGATDI
jgi:hypothetical protein